MRVDQSAIRVNQLFIVVLTVFAFVLGESAGTWLLLALAIVMALGAAVPSLALFQQLYHRVLKPARILRPSIVAEDPMAPRFAQGIGAAFLLGATAFLLGGAATIGWTLSWIVTVLATINLTVNFCAGCFVYFQLERLGIIRTSGGQA